MKHCCKEMKYHIYNSEKIIRYDPPTRSYGIRLTAAARQRIDYCPWCGVKLPKELGDELCEIIFDQLNLDDFQDPRLPEEFKTDEWWKKRGL